MGILLNLTKEYFGEIERDEDIIEINGVNIVSFTDGNGKFHENGYQPEDIYKLKELMQALIKKRGNEGDFNDVNTSLITNMSGLFYNNSKFNGDISGWVFPKVTNMNSMFEDATSFNQPIEKWKFPKVEYMAGMFKGAKKFNQPIGKWKFSKVRSMIEMFKGATSFDQDISKWDVNHIFYTEDMFKNCPIKKKNKPKGIK